MKQILTVILFFIGLSTGFCQTEVQLMTEEFVDTPMDQVIAILKEKYHLKVGYDHQDVQGILVTQKLNNIPLADALEKIFYNTGLECKIKADQVLVRKLLHTTSATPPSTTKQRTISGKIINAKTGEGLEFATIYSKADNQGIQVALDGTFEMTIESEEQQGEMVVQHLGYEPRTIFWYDKDPQKKLNIGLNPKALEFETITITDRLPTLTTSKYKSAITLNTEQLQQLPAFVGGTDLMRNIQLLPGISADDDVSAELRVRGSNGDENMVVLDGITLYKVDHYFGIFSAINSRMVNQVNVYKNAFPAQYGGRTASVIEFSSESNNKPTFGGGFDLNLLTSSANLQLPAGDNMVFQFAGRLTNRNVASTDLFNILQQEMTVATPRRTPNRNNNNPLSNVSRNDLIAYTPNFKFYDFNAKWAWKLSPTTRFSTHYFQGYDAFDYNYSQEFVIGAKGRTRTQTSEKFEEISDWLNRGVSSKITQLWTDHLQSELSVSYSSLEEQTQNTTTFTKVNLRRDDSPVQRTRDTTTLLNNNYNQIAGTDINLKNTFNLPNGHQAVFGYNYLKNKVVIDLSIDDASILGLSPTATQQALYGQYDFGVLEDQSLKVSLGLRGTHYSLTNQLYWSPRISTWYQANEQLQLKGSWSRYNQFLRRNYYEDRFGRSQEFWMLGGNRDFPVATANNWMVGFNILNNWIELDVEYFEKNTTGIIELAQPTIGLRQGELVPLNNAPYKVFQGSRNTKGIDVLLKKSTKQYAGWIAYTLSKTTNSFAAIRKGDPYPARDDRRHQLKWVNQYRYKQFDFSLVYVFSSGKPYTDLANFTDDPKDRGNVNQEDQFSYLESYQRVDIGTNYRFQWNRMKGTLGFSVFNLFNRTNVKYRQYILSVTDPDPDRNQPRPKNAVLGTELQMLGLTPNISFSLEF